ncbi:hypothetical protein A2914_02345 [Candidatus Nomurabacteria bacterium RIFCSPLOWO2_01_FULL_41_21]|uniref:Uncharacterized protein n=1 Tax=Candidatus Nomurabacteria bacterium RIFCSPLOWO2_01_FULL_41_21 TaxID=1801776 RepID=A0A1F6X2V3_9BACT|nr:MAG: hypothetical protein A2914_02345 [Candidatus Nomurabacteria bacterium RIFCSPLOWO2_01_FULL_41_21]
MQRARTLLILGIWVAILSHLGFPLYFKNILFAITGLFLMYIGFIAYKEVKKEKVVEKFDNFSENNFNEKI